MPEEYEDPGIGNPEVENQEEETAGVEAPPERTIPYDRFQQVNSERNQLANELAQMRQQMLYLQQMQMQHQVRSPEPDVDPDIERAVGPVVQKQIRALQQQIAQRDEVLTQVAAKAEADAAWNYVVQNVPDIDELKADVVAYLESLPAAQAQKYTSDPDNVVMVANFVRSQKMAGKVFTQKQARADLKNRARTETAGSSRVPSTSTNTDWSSMSTDDFIAAQKKMGLKPINEW